MHVMMIVNNRDDYLSLSQSIEKFSDFEIVWRESIQTGLTYLESKPVDIVLLDMPLQAGNDFTAFDQVQSLFPALPIVVCGGDSTQAFALESIGRGAQDYLIKGQFDGAMLEKSLRYAVVRKRLEEQLREGEEQFRDSFKYAAIGKALVSLDGQFLQVNPAISEIVGYSEPELLTKTFQDITHPDDLETDLANLDQLLAGEIQSFQMEKRYFHKLGHEVWVLLSVSLVRDKRGQPLRFIAQIQNITERKVAETALRESEERLQAIFRVLPVGVSLTDKDRRIVQMNLALEKILDMNMQDLLAGKYRSRQYIHADGTPILPNELPSERAFIEQRAVSDTEIGIVKEDGEIIWTSVSAAPLPNNQGYVVVTADITERNKQRSALQESERQFRLLAQNSPDVVYILDVIQQRAIYLNRTEFLGYSQKEVETSGSLLNAIHPDDKARVLAYWDQMVMRGDLDQVGKIEYRLRDKQGQWQWIQSRETIFASTPDGKPTQILVTLTVITEQKQAEEKLKYERDILRTLIDSSPDYIFVKDAEERFIVSNIAHAIAANVAPDDLVGKTAFNVFPPELAAQFHADDKQVMESGEPLINLERTTVSPDGSSRTVLTSKIPLKDQYGQLAGLVGISRDITERKLLEMQTTALAAERKWVKVLQRFINDISHDFRTPLSIINSSLYLLQKNTDPQKRQIHAQKIEAQIMRLDKLLAELLQMGRLDETAAHFQFSTEDINTLITPLILDYESVTATRQIAVKFDPESTPCLALVDTVEFTQAIINVFENAIAYTPQGGSITIRTRTEAAQTIISVQDTGIGIEAADLPHIFERFYRADEARSTDTGGTGLGLSIAQSIIEAHRGTIEVESAPGQGSTFSIKLPSG